MGEAAKAVDRRLIENVTLAGEGEVTVEMEPGQLGQRRGQVSKMSQIHNCPRLSSLAGLLMSVLLWGCASARRGMCDATFTASEPRRPYSRLTGQRSYRLATRSALFSDV